MLAELKKQLQGKYPMGCAHELEEAEKILSFDKFDSETALSFGIELVQSAKKYTGDIVAMIIRESDQATVFQYIGDSKSQKNIEYAQMKRNAVLKTGHCSLWAMAQAQTVGGVEDVFIEENKCLPVGGAFPIYVENKHIATICTSGLHQGQDHLLVVDALANYLNKKVPVFHGQLI